MIVTFLDPILAHKKLQSLYINRGCTKAHFNRIKVFNSEQKTLLLFLLKKLENVLSKYSTEVGDIEFILLEKGVYWDFPFTWGKTMIMLTPKIFEQSKERILSILTHEWVHLQQRKNIKKFEKYYKTLGFIKSKIEFGALSQYILRNPDADNYEWSWRSDDGGPLYAPIALLHKCKFKSVLLEIADPYAASYGDDNQTILHSIEDIESYYTRFGTKRQLYHPNEITAHLISEYLIDKKKHIQINYSKLMECII